MRNIIPSYIKWIWGLLFLASLVGFFLYFSIPPTASAEYKYTVQVLFKYAAAPAFYILFGIFLYRLQQSVSPLKRWINFVLTLAVFAAAVFYYTIPDTASPEYSFTIQQIFKYMTMPGLYLVLLMLLYKLWRRLNHVKYVNYILAFTGAVCILIPLFAPEIHQLYWPGAIIFSVFWIIASLSLGLLCFNLVGGLSGVSASVFSIFGTILLIFGCFEIYFLLTPQRDDGQYVYSKNSKYVLANQARPGFDPLVRKKSGFFPVQPAHPSHSVAIYKRRYDKDFYDVRYTLDKYGHRIVAYNPDKPEADLMLFGGSFTLGEGLENEQTWAWKLSKDLGPAWKVTNFGMSAFGAHQMLGLLEEREIEPAPEAPVREALFLGIRHHILRFTGIVFNNVMSAYKYKMENGQLKRDGFTTDSKLQLVPALPEVLNGSQAARALSDYLTRVYANKFAVQLIETYTAILIRASKLFRENYNTRLTVLLWPDIESIAPELEKEGIPVLYARSFLKSWDSQGESYYQLIPEYDVHPNAKATDELAAGLADYYRGMLKTSAKVEDGKR